MKIKVHNKEIINFKYDKPTIFMCNHTSLLDIPISCYVTKGQLRMIAKKELFKIPLFGFMMKKGQMISIDRNNPIQAAKDLKYAKSILKSSVRVWIAPEGSRSKDGKIGAFKNAPFKLAKDVDAVIIPMVINGANLALPNKELLMQKDKEVEVFFCNAVECSKYEQNKEGLLKLKNKVKESMLQYAHN